MAFGNATFTDASGAASDLFSSQEKAASLGLNATALRLKSTGDTVEGQNYDLASTLAQKNAQFAEESTAIQETQADRAIFMGIGATQSEIAGAGLSNSGSALDILRSGAQQGALQKELIQKQGDITAAGYTEQAQSYSNLSGYAKYAAGVDNQMADATDQLADKTKIDGMISAGIKGAAAVATLFTGGGGGDGSFLNLKGFFGGSPTG